jgi:hypothetical protein
VSAVLKARITPVKPHRAVLLRAPRVSWAQPSTQPPGTIAQFLHVTSGGCEPRHCFLPGFQREEMDIPAYHHWMQQKSLARAIRIMPGPRPFGATNVNNGIAWPLGMPNLWISDPQIPLPQAVELDFGTTRFIDTVQVAFDTSLNAESSQAPAFWKAPTCAEHWRLYVRAGEGWQRVFEETGNYQRRRVARFTALRTTGLKLEILATQGDASARVYEIRAYHDGKEPNLV